MTIDDLVAFNLHVAFAKRSSARLRRRILSSVVVGVLFGALVAPHLGWPSWGVGALIAFVVFVASPAIDRNAIEKAVRNIHADDHDRSTLGPREFHLNDQYLSVAFETGESRYEWRNVREFIETQSHIFVFLSPVKAFLIPKNGTLSGADSSEIMAELRKRAPAADSHSPTRGV